MRRKAAATASADYRAISLKTQTKSVGTRIAVAVEMSLIGVGDIRRNGGIDLLLRHRLTGNLLISPFNNAAPYTQIDLGKPKEDWVFAGFSRVLQQDCQEILFQEKSTGEAFAWTLDAGLHVSDVINIEVGLHNGLRVHLAER
jgi:hypothetical protein